MKTSNLIKVRGIGILTALFLCSATQAETVDKIIAKVGTEVITQSDFNTAMQTKKISLLQQYGAKDGAELFSKYRVNALEEIVLQKILDTEIQREKITITDDVIEREYEDRLRQMHLTGPDFVLQLAASGLSLAEFKKNLRRELGQREFVAKKIAPLINISDVDLKKEYDSNLSQFQTYDKFRFIEAYLPTEKFANTSNLMQAAQSVREAIAQDKNTAAVIKQYSFGAYADRGGDSGLIEASTLRAEIRQVLENLKPGETSQVLTTDQGVFIFKLLARADPKPLPFSAVSNQLRSQLTDKRVQLKLRKYLLNVKDETYVEIIQ